MFRPLPVYVGLRYTRAKRRNHFISFISVVSIAGIILGVWALITVLSIMNGFQQELRDRILGVASHVTISGWDNTLPDWEGVSEGVRRESRVAAFAPYVLGQGMFSAGKDVAGAIVRGVEPALEKNVSEIADHMILGSLEELTPGEFNIVLGSELARMLGVHIGHKVTLTVPQGQVTPAGLLPRMKRFSVVGIFKIGMYEYDSGLAVMHLDDAAKLYRTEGQVSGLRLRLHDVFAAPAVRARLAEKLGASYRVGDWTREHANFFRALKIEKRVMFIILFLIIAVAAFNLVSSLVMLVTDKQADIAILRTLGLSPRGVMAIFLTQGVLVGAVGTVLGAGLGVITALNIETIVPFLENLLGAKFFPADVYVISDFPAELHWDDVAQIAAASFIMSALATLYPAWRGARTQPAEALRYE
jgi:lipoprotein-releasing system permease protein